MWQWGGIAALEHDVNVCASPKPQELGAMLRYMGCLPWSGEGGQAWTGIGILIFPGFGKPTDKAKYECCLRWSLVKSKCLEKLGSQPRFRYR